MVNKKTSVDFGVSEYLVCAARTLVKEKGILAIPESKKGKPLSSETLNTVKMFYHNEEFQGRYQAKKDFLSVSKNVHAQKRLILCNLRELHSAFKSKYSTLKVSFSKFCVLRLKWCIVAGASGTHSVCVCTILQNVKLLLSPMNLIKL